MQWCVLPSQPGAACPCNPQRLAVHSHLVHKCVQIGIPPSSIVGRYSCPYNNIVNTHWWNTQKSGGCIVEQATHFVDLIRHLSGADVVRESIQATAVGPEMRLREMAPPPQAEHTVSCTMLSLLCCAGTC